MALHRSIDLLILDYADLGVVEMNVLKFEFSWIKIRELSGLELKYIPLQCFELAMKLQWNTIAIQILNQWPSSCFPIHSAIDHCHGNSDVLHFLLQFNFGLKDLRKALIFATRRGRVELTRALIARVRPNPRALRFMLRRVEWRPDRADIAAVLCGALES